MSAPQTLKLSPQTYNPGYVLELEYRTCSRLGTEEMADDSSSARTVSESVTFCLEDGDTSDGDNRSADGRSLVTTPSELKQYVGAEGGDDVSLCSHVSNENDSSCDSLVDTEEICPR